MAVRQRSAFFYGICFFSGKNISGVSWPALGEYGRRQRSSPL